MFQFKLKDRVDPHNMGADIIRRHRSRHHGNKQADGKSFVNLLKCKHHTCQGRMERRCQPRTCPAGHKISLLCLSTVKKTGNSLSAHGSQLDGRAFSSEGKTAQQTEKSAGKFGREDPFPVLAELSQHFALYLRYTTARDHRLPFHQPADQHRQQEKHCKPSEDPNRMAVYVFQYLIEPLSCKSKGDPVEHHDQP